MGRRLRVTELEVRDHPDAVVRGFPIAKVVIVARTEPVEVEGPDNLDIEWSGDLGLTPEINGNILETRFAPEAHTVTATGAAGGSSVTVRVWRSEAEVVNGPEFAITDEPQMPVITARVRIIGPVIATFSEWTCNLFFAGADDCPNLPHFGEINSDEFKQVGGDQFTPDFDKVRGRSVFFSVRFTIEGQALEEFAFAGIDGTNPQRSEIQAALPHDALRRIACRESGQRQFDAPADGGVGGCPLYSSDRLGRVGIMQVPDPTPDHVWNWRLNVIRGIEIFNENVDAARAYPSEVRNSEEFRRLVVQFNQGRQQQGLNPIQVTLPDFTTGNFDDDLQQLELDAIRGYNGWNGSDRFDLELHEFRVAVERIDGEEVLVVINVTEETLQGEAVWEGVPVTDRPADIGNPNYVEEVLAFDFGCSPAPTPDCPVVFITVDPSDTKTHAIAASGNPFVGRHFVTVKGTGDIVLRANINPDTPRLRSLLTWEADGAAVNSPALGADRLTAKISRNTPGGARIPVRVKLGSQTCKDFLVWIIWCTLKPNIDGTSTISGKILGAFHGRDEPNGRYEAFASIDFTATIHPPEIITDIDRPAIEDQERQRPPGPFGVPPPLDAGVAGPGNLDTTGSGFSGWDMSRQIRLKVFKGNPDKVPPVPIAETTARDPLLGDRPIPNYPANDVEGNDDSTALDEDSNPYAGKLGELRSWDGPRVELKDALDHTGNSPGKNGDTYRRRAHFREFVRVQLGTTWYRCSEFGLWRWHMFAKRLSDKWDMEILPSTPSDIIDDSTNNDF